MDWKLHAVYLPASELNSALQFYRDQIGLEEVWREGDLAIAFQLPEIDVQLIIGQVTEHGPVLCPCCGGSCVSGDRGISKWGWC